MLSERFGEGVIAGVIGASGKVQVFVVFGGEHGVDATCRGHRDGAGWEAAVSVSVVGGVYLQVLIQDAAQPEVPYRKLDRRVGL